MRSIIVNLRNFDLCNSNNLNQKLMVFREFPVIDHEFRLQTTLTIFRRNTFSITGQTHEKLKCLNCELRLPTIKNFSKKKACLFVFDCLNGNVCSPFKTY